ncbi:metallophosphoesterase family protein [Jhaorihella thermophila]|uniref:Serine/threonine protein phosphatase 1 n=1 Tax=Jhaorihella thermophila TaxID=488547 RepID=A0A1H5YKQ5_9RHOB|nr:metallophosphoesterase family protein [Jhaorihella thermophila]SEG24658.1 serine/threonine protein phosphatase 1 [Jhaorihella thermophila]
MRGVLGQVFSSRDERRPRHFLSPLTVARPAYYIGDIHGNYDSLARLMDVLDRDPARESTVEVVFLGDYVDRGERSREVLTLLQAISREAPQSVIMLMGNHERMMLDFLVDPARKGAFWLTNGGLQTLASFGIGGVTESASSALMENAAKALAEKLTPPLIEWLQGLPLWHQNGNLFAAHAGANPDLPVNLQSEKTLLWGHPEFRETPREDGNWIIHGHTTYAHPQVVDGRIGIDTGAYHSGILTAAYVQPHAPVRFIDSRA